MEVYSLGHGLARDRCPSRPGLPRPGPTVTCSLHLQRFFTCSSESHLGAPTLEEGDAPGSKPPGVFVPSLPWEPLVIRRVGLTLKRLKPSTPAEAMGTLAWACPMQKGEGQKKLGTRRRGLKPQGWGIFAHRCSRDQLGGGERGPWGKGAGTQSCLAGSAQVEVRSTGPQTVARPYSAQLRGNSWRGLSQSGEPAPSRLRSRRRAPAPSSWRRRRLARSGSPRFEDGAVVAAGGRRSSAEQFQR